jgi:DNA-binding transcriptional LysR family regulator
MDERDWAIIKILHKNKNITKTAQELFISQPALSSRIKKIEDELEVKIICRGTKGIDFTPEGEYLADASNKIISEIDYVKGRVLDMGSAIKGTLKLGASNYLSIHKIPTLLGRFKKKYPDVKLDIVTVLSKNIPSMLHNRDINIGFTRADMNWKSGKELLYDEPICAAYAQKFDITQLPGLPRIDYHSDTGFNHIIDKWWLENFNQPPKVEMVVSYIEICKAMVRSGLGYAIAPDSLFDDIPGIYKIRLYDRLRKPIMKRTWILFYSEMLDMKIMKHFIDFAKENKY